MRTMRTKMSVVFTLLLALAFFCGPAIAQNIFPETVFPYTIKNAVPSDEVDQCEATIIPETICEVDQDAGITVTKNVPYSGTVDYSGPTTVNVSGTVPFETFNKLPGGTFTYAVVGAGICGDVGDDGKVNCCEVKGDPGGTVHMVCYKVPAENIIFNQTFSYDICEAETAQVPWSYNGPGNEVAANIAYNGTTPYDVKEYGPTDVTFIEGTPVITCPPEATMEYKQLVTRAFKGDKINIEGVGFSYVAGKTIQQRLIVHYKPTSKAPWVLVDRTEKETLVTEAGKTFKGEMFDVSLDNIGIYRIQYKVWKKTATGLVSLGKDVSRFVTVEVPLEP